MSIFVILASMFTWGAIFAVIDGRVEELSKYHKGRIILFASEPSEFWMATSFYFLMAGLFWYFVFWFYKNRIK